MNRTIKHTIEAVYDLPEKSNEKTSAYEQPACAEISSVTLRTSFGSNSLRPKCLNFLRRSERSVRHFGPSSDLARKCFKSEVSRRPKHNYVSPLSELCLCTTSLAFCSVAAIPIRQ